MLRFRWCISSSGVCAHLLLNCRASAAPLGIIYIFRNHSELRTATPEPTADAARFSPIPVALCGKIDIVQSGRQSIQADRVPRALVLLLLDTLPTTHPPTQSVFVCAHTPWNRQQTEESRERASERARRRRRQRSTCTPCAIHSAPLVQRISCSRVRVGIANR